MIDVIVYGVTGAIVGSIIGFISAMYLCWKQESTATDKKLKELLKK